MINLTMVNILSIIMIEDHARWPAEKIIGEGCENSFIPRSGFFQEKYFGIKKFHRKSKKI